MNFWLPMPGNFRISSENSRTCSSQAEDTDPDDKTRHPTEYQSTGPNEPISILTGEEEDHLRIGARDASKLYNLTMHLLPQFTRGSRREET